MTAKQSADLKMYGSPFIMTHPASYYPCHFLMKMYCALKKQTLSLLLVSKIKGF